MGGWAGGFLAAGEQACVRVSTFGHVLCRALLGISDDWVSPPLSLLSPRGPGTLCPALSAFPSWPWDPAPSPLCSQSCHLYVTSRGPGMELSSSRLGPPHLLCSRSVQSQVPCTEQVFDRRLSYLSDLNLCLTNVCYRAQFLERGYEDSDVGPASGVGVPGPSAGCRMLGCYGFLLSFI